MFMSKNMSYQSLKKLQYVEMKLMSFDAYVLRLDLLYVHKER